jgi:hypothetical protein
MYVHTTLKVGLILIFVLCRMTPSCRMTHKIYLYLLDCVNSPESLNRVIFITSFWS